MVQPGFGGLDTPRTNVGDATYLSRQPDFDISQEASFQSPSKDNDFHQLRNGRTGGFSLRTPRGSRAPFTDRQNLPPSMAGAEFTPLLKSATRNSARRGLGKENGIVPNTPALDRIDEDLTPIPSMDTSMYTSRNISYTDRTLPEVDSSSTASTPMVLLPRRGEGKGPLQDGNQLSLREQENVIDKIEKENFGLKLKIHFLEEALRKAGPGFSEAALKENTELKVDKVTMQRDLQRYKKHLTTAERDLENYRQQMLEIQEEAKRKYADENQRAEVERLRKALEEKDADIQDLQRQLAAGEREEGRVEKLRDEVGDLEADVREKDRIISEHEDEVEELREKLGDAEERMKDTQRRMIELEEKAQANEELEDARETIEDLEHKIRRFEEQVDDMKEKLEKAMSDKDHAEGNLEELQEEMANKSMVTKGLSRQVEEKVVRLQDELEQAGKEYESLERQHADVIKENDELKARTKELRREREIADRERRSLGAKLDQLSADLNSRTDEKNLLQSRHDALTSESTSLQRDVAKLQKSVDELEENLGQEREHALEIEKDIRNQYKGEIDRLNDEISDLQAEIREKDNLYDNDSEKWETERHTLESERDHAVEKAAGLQRTINKLREAEGTLSNKEVKLEEAIQSETERHKSEEAVLNRQIDDLRQDLDARQSMLEDVRNELSAVRDELRQTQLDCQAQGETIRGLEDEIDVLQSTMDDELQAARLHLDISKRECDDLKEQLKSARDSAQLRRSTSPSLASQTTQTAARLQTQLADATTQLTKVGKDKQALQDQLATLNLELHSLQTTLAETKAERDEVQSELRRTKQQDDATFRLDQERIDLRTAKMKLDNEVRRLKEENKALIEQRQSMEKSLEEEIEKAVEEEDRLNQEVLRLQAKLQQSSDSQDLSGARRTIRELERQVEDYKNQLATSANPNTNSDGSSELSVTRRDLSAARQKELEYLQRESAHRDLVKSLKRQITDLERKAHESEMSRLISSPDTSGSSARKHEISELRHQLSVAHQSTHELKAKLRDADRRASQAAHDLQAQLDQLEDQKIALEQSLEDVRRDAEEAAAQHDKAVRRLNHKLGKAEQERHAALAAGSRHGEPNMSSNERRDLKDTLRKTQAETEALEHDILQQQETIDALLAAETSLRKKLERARSERAAYRLSAEKLQRDLKAAQAADSDERRVVRFAGEKAGRGNDASAAIESVVRAAEGAEARHTKELRGMVMQMGWMQARWEREAVMRADAAYAKKFLQLELDVANACNKAQLRELESIRKGLLGSKRALPVSKPASRPTLKTVAIMARFVARMQISARQWAQHEQTRRRIADCVDEMKRQKRMKQLKVVVDDVPA